MTTGHFALATISKKYFPETPLWALLFASWFLDFIMGILMLVGVEKISVLNPDKPAYGGIIVQGYFSHSLTGALIISVICLLIGRGFWGMKSGYVIGGLVFSHWLLDLLFHFHDLSILPFNSGKFPMLGFGLWEYPILAQAIEGALTITAIYLYYQHCKTITQIMPSIKRTTTYSVLVTAAALTSLLVVDFLAISLELVSSLIILTIIIPGISDGRLHKQLKGQQYKS